MSLDDIFGSGDKTPPNAKFPTIGTKVVISLTEDGKSMPVRKFVDGKPVGEQQFWQGKKVVDQSDLDLQLPFNPVPQLLLVGKTKDGVDTAIWADGDKLKALKTAVKETGVRPLAGTLVAMEYYADDPNGKGAFPKKMYRAQIKAAPDA